MKTEGRKSTAEENWSYKEHTQETEKMEPLGIH